MSLSAPDAVLAEARPPRLVMRRLIGIAVLVAALLSLRLVHLGADTPVLITLPDDVGLYVDEGYKTMGPRNRVLFGADSWHQADDYGSWRHGSALTQWSYYTAFRILTPDLGSARLVTILYFALFLAGYVWAMRTRLSWPVFIGGLIALGLESTLFFYSRIALFEVPIIVCVYTLLFCYARMDTRRWALPLLLLAACGAVVATVIKVSAVFYLIPIGLAVVIHMLVQTRSGPYRRPLRVVVFGAAVLSLVAFAASYDWMYANFIQPNVEQGLGPFSIRGALFRARTMPLMRASPFAVIAGLFCVAHGIATRADQYLGNLYRLSLICVVLLAPLIVAVFPYNPLRYYVPVLPAYVLLALEWIQLRCWDTDLSRGVPPLRRIGVIALLAATAFATLFAVARLCAIVLPPSLALRLDAANFLLIPAAAVLGALAWASRGTIFRPRALAIGQVGMALGFTLYSLHGVLTFLIAPTYQLRTVSREVARIAGPAASLAGDWAPIFALGTPVRALYMNTRFNVVANIDGIRPDYFVFSESWESYRTLEQLRQAPGVRIAEPIDVGTYFEPRRRVLLYPLSYDAPDAGPSHPPLEGS